MERMQKKHIRSNIDSHEHGEKLVFKNVYGDVRSVFLKSKPVLEV